jgi:excisionase family DNA binding protein
MSNGDPLGSVRYERQQTKQQTASRGKTDELSQRPQLLACLLLVPSDAEPIVTMLEQLVASSQTPSPFLSFLEQEPHSVAGTEDRWLEHTEAAKCLGVSKSTLYRYVSQRRIESRKIAGRLEYRQSVLEKLKREQTRPARPLRHAGGIIPPALHSGK